MRPLMPGEISMLRTVYNDTVDYGRVRIRAGAAIDPRTWLPIVWGLAVALGNKICFPRTGYRDDFSKEDVGARAWLVHEIGHVWQYQNVPGYSWIRAAFDRRYRYALDPDKPLARYGWEQQAAITADYYRLSQGYLPRHLAQCALLDAVPLLALHRQYETVLAPCSLGPGIDNERSGG